MKIKEQTEAFDAYFKDKYPELYKDVFDEDGDDRAIIAYSFALRSWLASENREGYKIVPVEPTKNMIISGNEYYSESCSLSGLYKAMIGAYDEP